jgi:hypothetical protein
VSASSPYCGDYLAGILAGEKVCSIPLIVWTLLYLAGNLGGTIARDEVLSNLNKMATFWPISRPVSLSLLQLAEILHMMLMQK